MTPEPLMAHLLIDSLRQQVAECRGDDLAADPSKWSHVAQIEGLRGHLEAAEQQVATLAKGNQTLLRALDKASEEVATLTEALETYGRHAVPCDLVDLRGPHPRTCTCGFLAALAAAREPITYERCSCDHPGDTAACDVDHDQVQHERET